MTMVLNPNGIRTTFYCPIVIILLMLLVNWNFTELKKLQKFVKQFLMLVKFVNASNPCATKAFSLSSQYVRVAHTTSEDTLKDLLTNQWNLDLPPIIISVTGGAKDFKMRSRLTKEFQRSLVKAAESTGAWIVTGGTHAGVMKHVGNAIHKHNTTKSRKVVALGIATWGIVESREILENGDVGYAKVQYTCENHTSLDEHHTHFILVDDGSEGKFGKEIELRAKLEKSIADSKDSNVQVVCVIVQGGPGSLKTVYNALAHDTPVVVIEGSGGWANILASLCNEKFNNVSENKVLELMKENGSAIPDRAELSKLINWARECVKSKNLITVFSVNQAEGNHDLDNAILKAILNANFDKEHQTKTHLELALAWNRADIAQTDILTDSITVDDNDMMEIFLRALKENKHGFVQVLHDYGLRLRKTFKNVHLIRLYKSAKLLDKEKGNDDLEKIKKKKNSLMGSRCKFDIEDFEDAGTQGVLRELFIWCILSNKEECAHIIWNALNEELLASAIVANSLIKSLAKETNSKDEKEDLMAHADKYKTLSYGILSECFTKDSDFSSLLLKRKMEHWGNQTCLEVAVDVKEKEIVAHPAVQYFLDNIWFGGIMKPERLYRKIWLTVRIFFGYFLPFLIPLLFDFKTMEKSESDGTVAIEGDFKRRNTIKTGVLATHFQMGSDGSKTRSFKNKIKCFYLAPVVKFHLTVLFYLIFLLLFGYILLFNFYSNASGFEYALIAWVIALMLEEARQLWDSPRNGLKTKAHHYITQFGNILDILAFVFFFIGLALRLVHQIYGVALLDYARVLLCLAYIVFTLRLLSMFTVNEQLGPKLLMVREMMKDLFFFLFILAVFLIAYGVASQSLLYPNESDAGTVFEGILSKPYWHIFGELFLPEIQYNPTTDEFACTDNASLIASGWRRCPQQNVIVPIISSVYLLLANVLLLNLLIAMFSYTFDKLVDSTDLIWKYQRYGLIEEYYRRPAIVAPFSFIPFLWSLLCCVVDKKSKENTDFEQAFDEDTNKFLMEWEKKNAEAYLDEKAQKDKESVPVRVKGVSERLDALSSTINTVQENFDYQRTMAAKVDSLETKLNACNASLEWIISALINKDFIPEASGTTHSKARTSPYPDSNVNRFPLKDHMVPWNIPLPSYKPPSYTSASVLAKPPWADSESEFNNLPFNEFDEDLHVDRCSYMGKYDVVNGLPRNPIGRTGITGRGLLGRFGPNHAADPIITRWEHDDSGEIVKINGRPVLEFIAIKRQDATKAWAIPGGMVDPGESVTKTLQREFVEEVESTDGLSEEEAKKIKKRIDKFIFSGGTEIYRGYCDDYRNTDNAWIETLACNFHDEDRTVFESIRLSAGDGASKAKWKRIDKSLNLFADHAKYIEKVAGNHNAHY